MPQPSRRAVLSSSLAGVAALGIVAGRGSHAASTPAAAASLRSLPATHDAVLHAVRRLSFGATPDLVEHVRKVGVSAWLDDQLTATPDPHGTLDTLSLDNVPLPPSSVNAIEVATGRNNVRDLQLAVFSQAAWGDKQVHEVLVELFSNHLSVNIAVVGHAKIADDRDVVRKNVLGSFSSMLRASAQSPAMLQYLNNDQSYGSRPNENYARELMELHTVGVDSGYVQRDVHNAALALTGLSWDVTTGLYGFNTEAHYLGPVRVLGWSSANNSLSQGEAVALSLVEYLATHPSTAKRIATKLIRRFVTDTPSAGLIGSAAKVYLDHGTQIVPVLRHVLASPEFARSVGQKTQRPFDWAVAAVRLLGLQPRPDLAVHGGNIVEDLEGLGQAPFAWAQPDGYPDSTAAWASTASMLSRWNTAQALARGNLAGLQAFDAAGFLGTPVPTTAAALVDRVCQRMLIATRSGLHDGLLQGIGCAPGQGLRKDQALAHVPALAALLLSSPEAMVR